MSEKQADYKAELLRFAEFVLSCRKQNTGQWMDDLSARVNKVAEVLGESDRFIFDGDGLTKI